MVIERDEIQGEKIKRPLKELLKRQHHIGHSTLEFEFPSGDPDSQAHETKVFGPH